MTHIMIEAYKYQELGDKAKEKVKYWLNSDWQFDSWDRQYRTEELEKLGYSEVDMRYSGFSSQGDGASIACTVELIPFIKRHKYGNRFRRLLSALKTGDVSAYVQVTRDSYPHYVHEMMLRANADDLTHDLEYLPRFDTSVPLNPAHRTGRDSDSARARRGAALEIVFAEVEAIVPMVLEEVRDKSRELYKWLQDDYEWQFTDEYMIDTCEANEYLFDASGKPVHHLQVEAKEETVNA